MIAVGVRGRGWRGAVHVVTGLLVIAGAVRQAERTNRPRGSCGISVGR
jgi:hypothetical protein